MPSPTYDMIVLVLARPGLIIFKSHRHFDSVCVLVKPNCFVNAKIYEGNLPAENLRPVIEEKNQ